MIEKRIREAANQKVKVSITKKRRSKGGYILTMSRQVPLLSRTESYALEDLMEFAETEAQRAAIIKCQGANVWGKSKATYPTIGIALANLFTAVRVSEVMEFSIKPVTKGKNK